MNKILLFTFLISVLAFGQEEIPFLNEKDELVKVVPYSDGSFSIFTSEYGENWQRTNSRFYSEDNKILTEFSLRPKVGFSCSIHGRNNLQFPDMTVYHPELKLTIMLGGIGAGFEQNMLCRTLDEKGLISDIKFKNFKKNNGKLLACEIHQNNLIVIYSSNSVLKKTKFWLAVIDLKNKFIQEKEIGSTSENIGSYIGLRDGVFYFLLTENDRTSLNTVNSEARLEQIPIDFPEDLLSRQKYSLDANRIIEAICPVKYYADSPQKEICFILYGNENFICNLLSNNEILYQPILIPNTIKVIRPQIYTVELYDFRKAILVDTKKGTELLISNYSNGMSWGPCSLGRWNIQWDYSETLEPIDIQGNLMFGTPLDMIAYSGKNPNYEEWKESNDQNSEKGISLLRTLKDFQGIFSFIEFYNPNEKIPVKAILYGR